MRTCIISGLVISYIACTTFAEPAPVSETPQAADIINQSKQAAAALKNISFRASMIGDGMIAGSFTSYEGKVQAVFSPDAAPKIFVTGTRTYPNNAGEGTFKFASDGLKAYCVDDAKKTFSVGPANDGRAPERDALYPAAYLGKGAFAAEDKALQVVHSGVAMIDETECDLIDVVYDGMGRRKARFYISKADHLIRRIDRPLIFAVGGQQKEHNATIIYSIQAVAFNSPVAANQFTLSAPQGYVERSFGSNGLPRNAAAGDSGVGAGPRTAADALPKRPAGLQVGQDAPAWTLKDAEGKEVTLAGLRGKVVLLDFWATWCAPCRAAMPGVQGIADKYKDAPVAVYGINCMERGGGDPKGLAHSKGIRYGQLLDGNSVAASYGVRGLPTFCVIGKDGKVLYWGGGYNPLRIEEAIQAGLK